MYIENPARGYQDSQGLAKLDMTSKKSLRELGLFALMERRLRERSPNNYWMGSYKDGSMVFSAVPEDKGEGTTDYGLAGSGILEKASLG